MTEKQAPPPIPRAPRYKQALITWLGVYPALTLTLAILGPTIELWPLPLRTLLVSIVMVIAFDVADPPIPDARVPAMDVPFQVTRCPLTTSLTFESL